MSTIEPQEKDKNDLNDVDLMSALLTEQISHIVLVLPVLVLNVFKGKFTEIPSKHLTVQS